jgi:hypothetical protein
LLKNDFIRLLNYLLYWRVSGFLPLIFGKLMYGSG